MRRMFGKKIKERVYLDWAAATPLLSEVKTAMEPFLSSEFGNASAIHKEGATARRAVESARESVARAFQIRPEFVTFTSGGTEANNIAIVGLIEELHLTGLKYEEMEVVTTRIEHPSVLKTMEQLERLGVQVNYIGVSEVGKIVLSELKKTLSEHTVLVSCAYANSEIGVVQSLRGIRKIIREAEEKFSTKIFFHVDAAQAPLWLNCQFDSTGADFLALDSSKCCGPKGVGVLLQSRRAKLLPVTFGGGQESGLRPGTENVAGIVGAGVAFSKATERQSHRAEKVQAVRDAGIKILLETIPKAVLNGPTGAERVANNINISIPGLDTEFATVVLDKHGFAVSTKSACSGAGGGESMVVKEISGDPARALSTLRITIGPLTTVEQIKSLAVILKSHIDKMSTYSN